MIYAIDIDGTICNTDGNDYPNSTPKTDIIKRVNELYAQGHTIKIFTARGSSSGIDWRNFTERQLKEWGVKYHYLLLGKPTYDFIVDDKARCLSAFLDNDCPLLGYISQQGHG